MARVVYRFYCYRCMKEHESTVPYLLKCKDGLIEQIYCPNCRSWVSYTDTNLSQERYKLVHINEWYILDEDSKEDCIVYSDESKKRAVKICNMLNQNRCSVPQLHSWLVGERKGYPWERELGTLFQKSTSLSS